MIKFKDTIFSFSFKVILHVRNYDVNVILNQFCVIG